MLLKISVPGSEPEILSLATAVEKFGLDLYDIAALKRGHTLNYPNLIISYYTSSEA